MELNPITVMLVFMDSKGDRLLFRYPYENLQKDKPPLHGMSLAVSVPVLNNPPLVDVPMTSSTTSLVSQISAELNRKHNPYAISSNDELLQTMPPPNTVSPTVFGVFNNTYNSAVAPKGQLEGFTDEVLSTLFAVKLQLCNQKLELKVNDVRFVSHPALISRNEQRSGSFGSSGLNTTQNTTAITNVTTGNATTTTTNLALTASQPPKSQPAQPQQMLINIVFTLHAQASYSIVKCYYELSKRLSLALRVEEQRTGYCTDETILMARTHDELSSQQLPFERTFDAILERCSLAQALKSIYHDLCTTGLLNVTLNQYLTVCFCLPQKAHQLHKKGSMVDPEVIDRCLLSLKPYHGMLLVDYAELLDCVPPRGAARMLLQLVEIYTPLMSLQMLASEADMSLEHVYKIVSHLVYWGKAIIIYPLCETNVYVIAPDAPLHTKSHLVEKFSARFAGMLLFDAISNFSRPTSIGHLTTPLQQSARQGMLAQMVVWMLQHHLLMQLHTYVQFMPSDLEEFYFGVSSMNVAAGGSTDDCSGYGDIGGGVHENKSSMLDLQDATNTHSSMAGGGGVDSVGNTGELMISPMSRSINVSDDELKHNPYAISSNDELLQTMPPPNTVSPTVFGVFNNTYNSAVAPKGQLEGFTDEVLSTLFAVKLQLCNQKLELKVNDVRFVSHPALISRNEQRSGSFGSSGLNTTQNTTAITNVTTGNATTTTTNLALTASQPPKSQPAQPQQMLINIVFTLHAQASYSIVKCYYELSKRLSLALRVEEQRTGYCTDETILMARTHDELSSQQLPFERTFDAILERCSLAQALKSIYHDLCTTGLLNVTLNQYLTVCFCLPQKAHQLHKKGSMVDPEVIDRCLLSLKPYHGMLLVDYAELLDCVPPRGAARMLLQLVEIYTPLMSLQMLASEADMSLEHVYKIVSHLVYWGKAIIIYPLCETNVYVIAPDAPLHTKSHLVEKFSARFAGMLLFDAISNFSRPTSIGHLTTPLQQSARQGMLAQMVVWMLQHHLLMQLHTYVQFMPSDLEEFYFGVSSMNVAAGGSTDDCSGYGDIGGGVHENKSSMLDLQDATNTHSSMAGGGGVDSVGNTGELMISPMSRSINVSDDELNAGSMLSCTSQPLPVPHTSRRSITEDPYSGGCSTASDNIAAHPSSSHKSNFSITASISTENCDSIASIEDEEKIKELLSIFNEADRIAIRRIPASTNIDDLSLLVKLYQAGYFKSEHHLEEIMYFQSLRPAELLQLLDKFRDVLIIYETEDPAIASMYNNK